MNGVTRTIRTSDTNPLRVDFLSPNVIVPPGRLGMTIAPGKKDLNGWTGAHDRDLQKDLDLLFRDYNPSTVVSLMESFEYPAFQIPTLLGEILIRGAQVIHYPIKDVSVPASMSSFRMLIDDLFRRVTDGETVVVHCKGGLGRTGIVVAAVLVRMGHSARKATQMTRICRAGTIQTTEQEQFVRKYADAVASGDSTKEYK